MPIADLALGGDLTLTMGDFKTRSTGDICNDLKLDYSVSIVAGKHKSLMKTCGISFSKDLLKWHLKTWHMENGSFVNGCSFDTGTVEGYVKDAADGSGLSAEIRLFNDEACTDQVGSSKKFKMLQDEDGWYKFEVLSGTYYIQVTKDGYTSDTRKVVVKRETNHHAGTSVLVNTGNSTPGSGLSSNPDDYTVVLSWGYTPADLDSHFISADKNTHVYYSNMIADNVELDVDCTESYGPETVTIKNQDGFVYCVHDYTNKDAGASTALSYSNALVRVYKGSTEVKSYSVPQRKSGTVWSVFEVDSSGNIKDLNTFSYESSPESVGM